MKNIKYLTGLLILIVAVVSFVNYAERSKQQEISALSAKIRKDVKPDTNGTLERNDKNVTADKEKMYLNLGITIEEFKSKFNKIAIERNVEQLALNNIQYFDNKEKFAQRYPAELYLFGVVDKKTGFLKEVTVGKKFILSDSKRQSEVEVAGVTFLVAVAALNPELSADERADILNKLSEKPKNSSVVIGNAKYSSLLFDKGKSLSLSIEAKDIKD